MSTNGSKSDDSAKGGKFYGWHVVATAFLTFGLSVGIPYYNMPFFYDYFQKSFHWSLKEITFGFPLAALLTIWVGPALVPRFSPKKLIIAGTGLTALAFWGFSIMPGTLLLYFAFYFIYTCGYLFSGPIPHQILVSHWFRAKRGLAMGTIYVGVGLCGGVGAFLVRGLTDHYGFQTALKILGGLTLLAWPLAFFLLKDKPGEIGQFPDGADCPPSDTHLKPFSLSHLLHSRSFWLLLGGSVCSIGAIGSINLHMKFVFRDAGYTDQKVLNATWATASSLILWSSIVGRLAIGHLADLFSKKVVMTVTYFMVVASILLLLGVNPSRPSSLYVFAVAFGFTMGADYMLIPLMAAEQFGVNTLARAMAVILPANTIGQTWLPYFVSALRERSGSYQLPMMVIFGIAMLGAIAIALLPKHLASSLDAADGKQRVGDQADLLKH
jgi:MFS family permease